MQGQHKSRGLNALKEAYKEIGYNWKEGGGSKSKEYNNKYRVANVIAAEKKAQATSSVYFRTAKKK